MSISRDVEHRDGTKMEPSLDFSPYKQQFLDSLPGEFSLEIVARQARVHEDICNALKSELDFPTTTKWKILQLLANYGGAGLQQQGTLACRAMARAIKGQKLIEASLRAMLKPE
jgi:hypothetical protein